MSDTTYFSILQMYYLTSKIPFFYLTGYQYIKIRWFNQKWGKVQMSEKLHLWNYLEYQNI